MCGKDILLYVYTFKYDVYVYVKDTSVRFIILFLNVRRLTSYTHSYTHVQISIYFIGHRTRNSRSRSINLISLQHIRRMYSYAAVKNINFFFFFLNLYIYRYTVNYLTIGVFFFLTLYTRTAPVHCAWLIYHLVRYT